MTSIKKQLLIAILSILCLGVVATTITTYCQIKDEMDELFDENLKQVAEAITVHDLTVESSFSNEKTEKRSHLKGEEEFLIQIWNGKILSYSSLPAIAFPYQGPGGVQTVRFENQKWRYYGLKHGDGWLIQVSQPIPLRHTVIWEIYFNLLIPLLIQFPIIAGMIWLVIRRGFMPLSRISSFIERRDEKNLDRIPVGKVPQEVSVMVDALNGLLGRLAHALTLQRQFSADAAHELRTPLTAVRLELDILKRAENKDERGQSIQTLYRAVDRCARLVQQLLELARHEPDLQQGLIECVSLGELAHEEVERLDLFAQGRNISLIINVAQHIQVKGQRQSIATMIGNLVRNAVSYTPENGKVVVSVYEEDGHAVFSVMDNGLGIPIAEHARIFDRFYRILDVHTAQVNGSGLGLAIVKAVADQHNAGINITPGIDGHGVGFKVVFE